MYPQYVLRNLLRFILFTALCGVLQFKLAVPKLGVVSELCKKLSEKTAVPPDKVSYLCALLHTRYVQMSQDC